MLNAARVVLFSLAVSAGLAATSAVCAAPDLREGGKLLLTDGVSTVEGSAGGGIATWAVIAGDETRDGIGGQAAVTYTRLPAYDLRVYGGAVGLYNRLELSYAHQEFDTGKTGPKLGLPDGFTFDQDIVGVKVRLIGDAVYDQDSWLPQVALGAQFKQNDRAAIIHAVGGKSDKGVDYYVAATKVLLNQSLVLSATLRVTRANQLGLLGFGGDRNNGYSTEGEGSIGYLVTRHFVIGAEYRSKPNNLGFAKEDDWADLFAAYAINSHVSLTAAYVDTGDIATFTNQRGLYVSLKAGF